MIDQELAAKFQAATDRFASRWREGTQPWLEANAPQRVFAMGLAEKVLDSAWKEAKVDPTKIAAFDQALAQWERVHIEAIIDYEIRAGVTR